MRLDPRPHRTVVADVVPGPPHHHQQPVLEADQVVEVDDEPHQPPDEAGERSGPISATAARAPDRGERALVEVAERAPRRGRGSAWRRIARPASRAATSSAARCRLVVRWPRRRRSRTRRRRPGTRRWSSTSMRSGSRVRCRAIGGELGRLHARGPDHRRGLDLAAVLVARACRSRAATSALQPHVDTAPFELAPA